MIPWPQQPILNTPAEVTAWEESHRGVNYIDQHGQAVIRTLPLGMWMADGRLGMEKFIPSSTEPQLNSRTAIFRAGDLYRHGKSDFGWIWQLNQVGRQVIADLATLLPSTAAPAVAKQTSQAMQQGLGMSASELRLLADKIHALITSVAADVAIGSDNWKTRL